MDWFQYDMDLHRERVSKVRINNIDFIFELFSILDYSIISKIILYIILLLFGISVLVHGLS